MLVEYLKGDLSRITEPSFFNGIKQYFFPKGNTFRYIVWFRIMQMIKRHKKNMLFDLPTSIYYF